MRSIEYLVCFAIWGLHVNLRHMATQRHYTWYLWPRWWPVWPVWPLADLHLTWVGPYKLWWMMSKQKAALYCLSHLGSHADPYNTVVPEYCMINELSQWRVVWWDVSALPYSDILMNIESMHCNLYISSVSRVLHNPRCAQNIRYNRHNAGHSLL